MKVLFAAFINQLFILQRLLVLQQFLAHFHQRIGLPIPSAHFIIAVSGGLDSTVLVHLCQHAGFNYSIAHCNFQLREEESTRDEQFVRNLAKQYNKPFHLQVFNTATYAQQHKLSIQLAARQLRYQWFEQLVTDTKSKLPNPSITQCFLLTAHHADDNIETLLLNFFRGTGISGLHGILPKQTYILRPLLFAKRAALLSYAQQKGLTWVEDSSNASDKYARNYLRHQVIPLLKQIYPQVDDNLLENIQRFSEVEMVFQDAIATIKKKLLEYKGNEIHIPTRKLLLQQPLKTITYEIVKDYGFAPTQTDEVLKLLHASNGSYIASSTHRIMLNRNWLIITPILAIAESTHILIEQQQSNFLFPQGIIQIKTESLAPNQPQHISTDVCIAMLDAKLIQWPLLLRPWKQGDYFYPLGMSKKKKLSKFFIDQKLSPTDKEKVWVLEDAQHRILWIVGHRIDNRFKLTPSTAQMFQIKWIPK